MTREEAIQELKIQFVGEYDRQREAKDIAIKALEQEPCEELYRLITDSNSLMLLENYKTGERTVIEKRLESCEDAVSRQAVDELSKALVHTTRDKADFLCNFWEGLRKIPTVQPKEKVGEWIDIRNSNGTVIAVRCSNCEKSPKRAIKSDYCPNCGAKMKESEVK